MRDIASIIKTLIITERHWAVLKIYKRILPLDHNVHEIWALVSVCSHKEMV